MKWENEIENLVFDKRTLLNIAKLMKKGLLDRIEGIVSQGKEANVFLGKQGEREIAVKIYRSETTNFQNRMKYLLQDPRIKKVKKTQYDLACAYASREFKNLQIAHQLIQDVPQPFHHEGNVILMDFLGKEGIPYPQLMYEEVSKQDFQDLWEKLWRLWEGGLVHADISEYNILKGPRNYIIDWGQGLPRKSEMGLTYFKRDLQNLIRFFKKRGIDVEEAESRLRALES
ncbi:MAG: serine protein kinase RIO [Candidatus Micrarchaeota archaeon]|nr:serine protein kinase RIO [Candidatus Micrarchaeota archaeon]